MRVEMPFEGRFLVPYFGTPRFRVEPFSLLTHCCLYSKLELSDYSDSRVSVTRLLVYFPGLLGVSFASQVCGCVGHLIIFKQRKYSEDGDEASQEHKELSLAKWVVIIPGTNVNKNLEHIYQLVNELEISITCRNRERLT